MCNTYKYKSSVGSWFGSKHRGYVLHIFCAYSAIFWADNSIKTRSNACGRREHLLLPCFFPSPREFRVNAFFCSTQVLYLFALTALRGGVCNFFLGSFSEGPLCWHYRSDSVTFSSRLFIGTRRFGARGGQG